MKVYFHYQDYDNVKSYRDFAIFDYITTQYNHYQITHPKITIPSRQADKVSSSKTNNETYLQAGTGILTRFEIPYLKNLLELYPNVRILKAELVIAPVRNTYKTIKLPDKISLYATDDVNRFGSPILDMNTGTVQIGVRVIDEIYQEDTHYTFDVTNYIAAKLLEQTDNIPALLVSITPNDVYRTTDRLVIGSQQNSSNKVKLIIYYMYY